MAGVFAWVLALAFALVSALLQASPPESEIAHPPRQTPAQAPQSGDDAPAQNQSIPYQTYHVGGRLERVTVRRQHGFTELYRNNRPDTIWSAQENEIGEVPNRREWIIHTW